MKDLGKKIGIWSLVAVLYLGSTGLLYNVHTCLHSGKSKIEFVADHSDHEEVCTEEGKSCCNKSSEGIAQSDYSFSDDCCDYSLNFKKADLVSVQPVAKYITAFQVDQIFFQIESFIVHQSVFETINILDGGTNLDKLKQRLSRSSLEKRISLSSFLC